MAENSALFMVKVSAEGLLLGDHAFNEEVVTIGRDPQSDLHIDKGVVSRRHVQLRLTDEGFTVTALSSTNTTDLNDNRLTPDEPVELENGDLIVLSDSVHLRVVWGVEGEESKKAEEEEEEEEEEDDDGGLSWLNAGEDLPMRTAVLSASQVPDFPVALLEEDEQPKSTARKAPVADREAIRERDEARAALATQTARNKKLRADVSTAMRALDKAKAELAQAEEATKALLASLEASRRGVDEVLARLRGGKGKPPQRKKKKKKRPPSGRPGGGPKRPPGPGGPRRKKKPRGPKPR